MRYSKLIIMISLVMFAAFTMTASGEAVAGEMKVGFVYVGPVGDAGWSYAHDLGRKTIAAMPGIKTTFVENVIDQSFTETTLRQMAKDGNKLIFTTSFNHMNGTINVAKEFPDTTFMHCSGYMRSNNVGTYFVRQYQAYYLSGMVAGGMTKKNVIGIVGAHPIAEIVRCINAFTLGVRHVNPDAKVHALWTHSWFDPKNEKKNAQKLVEAGADVLAQKQDSPATQLVAKKNGVYSIGCNADMSRFAPKHHLTSAVYNWGMVYKHTVDTIRAGKWSNDDIWWGLEKEAVGLSPFGSMVPKSLVAKVEAKKKEIAKGKAAVFEGPIKGQNGSVKVEDGKRLTDKELLTMDWFVEGVVGKIEK